MLPHYDKGLGLKVKHRTSALPGGLDGTLHVPFARQPHTRRRPLREQLGV